MADLNKFRCPECNSKLNQESDFTIEPYDSTEIEISVTCCEKHYSTFIEASEFHLRNE